MCSPHAYLAAVLLVIPVFVLVLHANAVAVAIAATCAAALVSAVSRVATWDDVAFVAVAHAVSVGEGRHGQTFKFRLRSNKSKSLH